HVRSLLIAGWFGWRGERQAQREGAALSGPGLYLHLALVIVGDDEIRNGKAQAGSLANFLGGEKGLEDTLADAFGYTATVVFDLYFRPGRIQTGTQDDLPGHVAAFLVDGLGGILQQVQQHLFQLVADAGDTIHLGIEIANDIDGAEIEAFDQREVVAGDLQRLVDQHRQLALGQLAIAHPAETEHVADDLGRAGAGLLDSVQQLRHFAALQVLVDGFQLYAGFFGALAVAFQLGGQPAADILRVVQDGAERVVDLMGHTGRQAADRQHLLRLHHDFFHVDALGDVVDAYHHPATALSHQGIERQREMPGFLVEQPGDALDLGDLML